MIPPSAFAGTAGERDAARVDRRRTSLRQDGEHRGSGACASRRAGGSNDQWRVRMSALLSGRWSFGLDIRMTPTEAVDVMSILLRSDT